ncbi:MAG: hypothetical protein NTW95_00835 [Candidatus Aminicenantes bacterium]|nr:hypothetical protein [Candidatus Aminicenantes bacterium]
MVKKTLSILVLSGFLLLTLGRCAKSDELSSAEVNEIFNVVCLAINDALGQANASAMASTGRPAGTRHGADIITRYIDWQGSGAFAGVSVQGHITVDTESGVFDGSYTYLIRQFDASNQKQTVIIQYANGQSVFNGQASEFMQFSHWENHDEFVIIIDGKRYDGSEYYTLDSVGSVVTLGGTVILNGKEYALSN